MLVDYFPVSEYFPRPRGCRKYDICSNTYKVLHEVDISPVSVAGFVCASATLTGARLTTLPSSGGTPSLISGDRLMLGFVVDLVILVLINVEIPDWS